MRSYTTEAIVLKRWNLGEADRVLTLYTAERGQVSAIARGARKLRSKIGGHVELFSRGRFTLTEGRTFDTVTAADLQQTYLNIPASSARVATAHYVAEAALKLTGEGDVVDRLFELMQTTFGVLDQAIDTLPILVSFQVKLLALLGHQPVIDLCVHCRQTFGGTIEITGFDLLHGGVVCRDCAQQHGHPFVPCDESGRACLQALLRSPIGAVVSTAPGFIAASRVLEQALVVQAERPLKSQAFIQLPSYAH